MNSSIFNVFLNIARDVEEWTASGKQFHAQVAAAEKPLAPPPLLYQRNLNTLPMYLHKVAPAENMWKMALHLTALLTLLLASSIVISFILNHMMTYQTAGKGCWRARSSWSEMTSLQDMNRFLHLVHSGYSDTML